MALFYQSDLNQAYLTPEESHHAFRVLRMKSGDTLQLTDGHGTLSDAVVIEPSGKKTTFRVTGSKKVKQVSTVHLAIAPTKQMDRMEWMVEKCVEIGVARITFVQCRTSERKSLNLERINKVVISAMKQSMQAWLPQVNPMVPFSQFLTSATGSQKFIAVVDEVNPKQLASVAKPSVDSIILIGPEGDFSPDEVAMALQYGFEKVGLGPNRLRTETAGLYAIMSMAVITRET